MYNLITIKFYTKPYSIFLQRNGAYILNKSRIFLYFIRSLILKNTAFMKPVFFSFPKPHVHPVTENIARPKGSISLGVSSPEDGSRASLLNVEIFKIRLSTKS